jgi:hypothetical protein
MIVDIVGKVPSKKNDLLKTINEKCISEQRTTSN